MRLYTEGKIAETEDLEIQRGIFQGDSLSPLIICIRLYTITEKLNNLNTGYEEQKTETKVSHLFEVGR